jgi:8-oxo-dGTP pyrophosphatase MutT (NUDIX family)
LKAPEEGPARSAGARRGKAAPKKAKPKLKLKLKLKPAPRPQYAALPWRRTPDLEILLVTSRETGRWVIPKGWPMKSKSPRAAAAQEALEEAGVEGEVARAPLGAYDYEKILSPGVSRPCRVTVFALAVKRQRDSWREQGQRRFQWFPWEDAAAAVREPDLAAIIRAFAAAPDGAGAAPDGAGSASLDDLHAR